MATTARIDVRLRLDQKLRIEKAAAIRGVSTTDFIVQNAVDIADRTIQQHETWELNGRDAEFFFTAVLDAESSISPALMSAAQRYKQRYGE